MKLSRIHDSQQPLKYGKQNQLLSVLGWLQKFGQGQASSVTMRFPFSWSFSLLSAPTAISCGTSAFRTMVKANTPAAFLVKNRRQNVAAEEVRHYFSGMFLEKAFWSTHLPGRGQCTGRRLH